jgi:hypothetical protein
MYNMDLIIGSYKFRLEIVILIIIVSWILFGHLLCSCSHISMLEGMEMAKGVVKKAKEGFTSGNNSAYGPEFSESKAPGYILNPSTWSLPSLTYSPGTTHDAGIKTIWDRPKQPIPLPKDELDMFATTEFKPECCPNTYTNSSGCACMTVGQFDYLNQRGGNNVPYSQY